MNKFLTENAKAIEIIGRDIFSDIKDYQGCEVSKNREEDCISFKFDSFRFDYIVASDDVNNVQWYNNDGESIEPCLDDEMRLLSGIERLQKLI